MISVSCEAFSDEGDGVYQPGQILLDKYELVRPLAVGGMGVVWTAHNRVLDVDVALKLTFGGDLDSAGCARERALNEARLAAQLAHPAICRVLDFGSTEYGDPCVVTELLRGDTLESVLALEGRMSPVEAVQVILPILDGLSAAHEKGIVHRDVKPSNVYLARDAGDQLQPKLLDFGIARALNQKADWAEPGTVSGTPCYMSPEQARGSDDVDLRTDIWSTCATLYELLTAEPPFEGETCAEVLAKVAIAEPTPIPPECEVDPWLCAILMRGLARAPVDRWQSAAELASELARWLLAQGLEADACGHLLRTRVRQRRIGHLSALGPRTTGITLKSPGSGPRPIRGFAPLLGWRRPRVLGFAAGGMTVVAVSISVLAAWMPAGSAAAGGIDPLVEAGQVVLAQPSPPKAEPAIRGVGLETESRALLARPGQELPVPLPQARRPTLQPIAVARQPSAQAGPLTPLSSRAVAVSESTGSPALLPPAGSEHRGTISDPEANALGYDFGF